MNTQNDSTDGGSIIGGIIAIVFIGIIALCCCGGLSDSSNRDRRINGDIKQKQKEHFKKQYPWLK